MRKFHEKSIILGIGIGMIITAIAGMIFSAGTTQQPTKEEIIKMAKVYGLVEPPRLLKDDTDAANSSSTAASTTEAAASTTATATITATPASDTTAASSSSGTENSDQRNIAIVIKDGDKSKQVIDQLLQKGVITSEAEFNKVLDSYNASTKINYGSFKFKKNEDMDYIVKTICNIK